MHQPVLSFDLTGTLATFDYCDSIYFEGLPRLYASTYCLEIEQARSYLIRCYNEVGDHEADWYRIRYWFDRFELGDRWSGLLAELSCNIRFYPDTEPVLSRLSQEYDMMLVSNACREFLEVETRSISRYFTRTVSCVTDFDEVKKTPDFYFRLCQHLGMAPDEIIHIGDHWQFDYLAPQGAGLNALYLDRKGQTDGPHVIHALTELEDELL